jgi:hypothetical protein
MKERQRKKRDGESAKSFSRARERGEKSYRTRRVFEVGCPVALIELAISGLEEAAASRAALTQRDASSSGFPPAACPAA